eukprot:1105923-Rhodomonas_salina.1
MSIASPPQPPTPAPPSVSETRGHRTSLRELEARPSMLRQCWVLQNTPSCPQPADPGARCCDLGTP